MKLVKFIIICLVLITQASAQTSSQDCNNNNVDDLVDIQSENFEDCNGNDILDVCELNDYNGLLVEVSPGIFKTANLDQNNNGRLDMCEDCNTNQVPDLCDIGSEQSIWISPIHDFYARNTRFQRNVPYELPCAEICGSDEVESEGFICGTESDCQTSIEVSGYLIPDSCENDFDSDGTVDTCDECPQDPDKLTPGSCGCGVAEIDNDDDGTPECIDTCPNDPNKISPGVCGCGIADTDTDGDGEPDCKDQCPDDIRFIELPCSFECEEVNQLEQIFKLDGASYELSRLVASGAKILRNVTDNPNNGVNSEFKAQELYLANWHRAWQGLPILSLSCLIESACVVVSNVPIINAFNVDARKLRRLAFNMVARIFANTNNPTPLRRARSLRRKAKRLYRLAIATSGTIDEQSSFCPDDTSGQTS